MFVVVGRVDIEVVWQGGKEGKRRCWARYIQ
jgi:hypothetical protein